MKLSFEQLQAFVATIEQGGFKQAARSMGKHVSTVRELVNNFELDLGLTLFHRHARSLEPTPQGRDLYQFACSVLREGEHFHSKVDSLLQGEPSSLILAIDTTLSNLPLTPIICRLLSRYSQLKLKVLHSDTLQIRSWLLSGQADLGLSLATITYPHELQNVRSFSFEVVRVISATDCELPGVIELEQLRGVRQVALNFLPELGMETADILSNRVLETNNPYQLLQLVRAGVGFAHLPRFLCQELLDSGELKLLALPNESEQRVGTWFSDVLWLAEKAIDPAMALFIEEVKKLPDC